MPVACCQSRRSLIHNRRSRPAPLPNRLCGWCASHHLLQPPRIGDGVLLFHLWSSVWSQTDGSVTFLVWMVGSKAEYACQITFTYYFILSLTTLANSCILQSSCRNRLVRSQHHRWCTASQRHRSTSPRLGGHSHHCVLHLDHRFLRLQTRSLIRILELDPDFYCLHDRPWCIRALR